MCWQTSNWGNWQYATGVGVDPRSARQFNVVKQGKDYDAHAEFVSHWLPDLAEVARKHNVPTDQLHHPWTVQAIKSDLEASDSLRVYASPHYEQKAWSKHYGRNVDGGNKNGHRVGKAKGKGDGPAKGPRQQPRHAEKGQMQALPAH